MDELNEHLKQSSLIQGRLSCTDTNKDPSINENHADVAELLKSIEEKRNFCRDYKGTLQNPITYDKYLTPAKKVGPLVPPKPIKKSSNVPEIPQSSLVKQACEPLYAKRLQSLETLNYERDIIKQPLLFRKQISYSSGAVSSSLNVSSLALQARRKATLDNPAILEQQLEALEHHKKQLERRGKLNQNLSSKALQLNAPKFSTSSLLIDASLTSHDFLENSNFKTVHRTKNPSSVGSNPKSNIYENIYPENAFSSIYSNIVYDKDEQVQACEGESDESVSQTLFSKKTVKPSSNEDNIVYFTHNGFIITEDDVPPPPSPVSSSYSELRRATEVFKAHEVSQKHAATINISDHMNIAKPIVDYEEPHDHKLSVGSNDIRQMYINKQSYANNDAFLNCSTRIQISSTYESIYEPINPRPPSQLSTRSHNLMYPTCIKIANAVNLPECGDILAISNSSNLSSLSVNVESSVDSNSPLYPNSKSEDGGFLNIYPQNPKELEVKSLRHFLVKSLNPQQDLENYGICFKCNEIVVGENSGCTAMGQIYHITCFTCSQCQINLQGKPFYALDCKPYCEFDYIQTLEKCSVCMKPILERILRATGKPYHPQCFTCVVCKKSLDGIPFTVDATNQNYCIEDFHKKFAPRCCVCEEPIMPEPGEEETVRVVALDRSFHFECYKCEDCSLLLSSEAEGRGCYPLDDHVLCKSCNAKRVQMLTNRMTTTEL